MNSTTPQEALDRIAECKRTGSKILDLSFLGLTKIPIEISELIWLEELDIYNNKITKIEGLENLSNLSSVELHNNKITYCKILSDRKWIDFKQPCSKISPIGC